MKVISLKKFGGPEVLELENVEIGKPGPKEVLVKNLSEMPATERPIHCCDKKKLQFYVKDEDTWAKDIKNEKINKTLDCLSKKQVKAIKIWEDYHPNWHSDEALTEEYINLVQKITNVADIENLTKKNLETIYKTISDNTDWLETAQLCIQND
mgnify:CR=1 FL=1